MHPPPPSLVPAYTRLVSDDVASTSAFYGALGLPTLTRHPTGQYVELGTPDHMLAVADRNLTPPATRADAPGANQVALVVADLSQSLTHAIAAGARLAPGERVVPGEPTARMRDPDGRTIWLVERPEPHPR